MTQGESAKSKSGLFATTISVICCVVAAIVGWYLAPHSPYAVHNPTQYGRLMLAIVMAGLAGTLASYIHTFYCLFFMEKKAKAERVGVGIGAALILLAMILAGTAIYSTFLKRDFYSKFESGDLFALYFALASAIAVFIISKSSHEPHWRLQFWVIELPLLVSLALVILGRIVVFNQTSPEFNDFVTRLPYYPTGQPFGWEVASRQIPDDFRAAFWAGATSAVVGVQLIMAQVAALGLEIYRFVGLKTAVEALSK